MEIKIIFLAMFLGSPYGLGPHFVTPTDCVLLLLFRIPSLPSPTDLTQVPSKYHDLGEVLSKDQAL